jgi:3-deoxy-D-arabino-heptulosonate 7-phosphate (DAHP) synthase
MKNKKVKIIAGPCSISRENVEDIYKIAQIRVKGKFAIFGTRVVGLKSRTEFQKSERDMGIDFEVFLENLKIFQKEKSVKNFKIFPSLKIAREILKKTNLLIATEIMEPLLQLPLFEKIFPKNKLLIWNPAVNQLGWPLYAMARFVEKNGWFLGIKNPKWLGKLGRETSMEKTWKGLVSYANLSKERIFLLHRGIDVEKKGNFRNLPVHDIAKRVKRASGALLFFDPSHSLGPKMRDKIVSETVRAMKMKISKNEYLYDGILIEVGRSFTDSAQHISIEELKELCLELSKFRELEGR